jgi:hypothetical protein
MKQHLIVTALIGLFGFMFIACDNESVNSKNGNVELYMLDSYKTIGSTSQIDESTVVLKNKPLLTYSDILSYDSSKFVFKISDNGKVAIENLQQSVRGVAFGIKANNVLIYTGYFWSGFSSLSCQWVVIDPLMVSLHNELRVDLGYPGSIEGQVIPDKRNDKRILDIFASNNKLIK